MVSKFPYEKAVLAIAQGDLFGDKPVLDKLGVTSKTLYRWRLRAKEDPTMSKDVLSKKRMLLNSWQEDATRPLKVGFDELARRMPIAKDATDAKIIFAISGAVKILGELKLDSTVLLTGHGDSESIHQPTETRETEGTDDEETGEEE